MFSRAGVEGGSRLVLVWRLKAATVETPSYVWFLNLTFGSNSCNTELPVSTIL
jgi:hypothetical protein